MTEGEAFVRFVDKWGRDRTPWLVSALDSLGWPSWSPGCIYARKCDRGSVAPRVQCFTVSGCRSMIERVLVDGGRRDVNSQRDVPVRVALRSGRHRLRWFARRWLPVLAACAGVAVGLSATWGTVEMDSDFEPPTVTGEQAGVDWRPAENEHPAGDELDRVIARVAPDLMSIAGVHGVGRGLHQPGADAIVVHVENDSVRDSLPARVEGYPVLVEVVPGGFGIDW